MQSQRLLPRNQESVSDIAFRDYLLLSIFGSHLRYGFDNGICKRINFLRGSAPMNSDSNVSMGK
jgi:hypothetical protein